jgi:hypothetical protein
MEKKMNLIKVILVFASLQVFALDHGLWDQVLKSRVDSYGFFDYKSFLQDKSEKKKLTVYLDSLSLVKEAEYNSMSVSGKKSFLINAYNAFTVKLIAENFWQKKNKQLESIKDLGGWFSSPWKKDFFSLLGGKIKNLDQIEHGYLREKGKKKKTFHDYRVHGALNCASRSCPRLRNESYSFDKARLNAQLDEQMRLWLNDTAGINCNKSEPRNIFSKDKITISKIFKWFPEDFTRDLSGNNTTVKDILIAYGSSQVRKVITSQKDFDYDYLDYNWDLNQACIK